MWAAIVRECFNDARAAIRRWPLNEALHSENEVLHQPAGGEDASNRTSTSYEPQSRTRQLAGGEWRLALSAKRSSGMLCRAFSAH